MKRLLSVLLAVCLCISLGTMLASCAKCEHTWDDGTITTPATKTEKGVKTFTCTKCSETKTEPVDYVPKTTVTATEWEAAFDLGDNWTVSYTATHPVYQQTMAAVQKTAGNKFHSHEELRDEAGAVLDSEDEYAEIVDGVWYDYSYDEDEGKFVKRSSSDTVEYRLNNMIEYYLPDYIRNPEEYTYDTEAGAYIADVIVGDHASIDNVTLRFEDGKLVSMTYSITMQDTVVPYALTFTYGDATVTLPSVD